MKRSLFFAGLALALGISPIASTAAPLCSGATSVSALGATGCEIGDVTLFGFSISDASVLPGTPADGIDPDNILVTITLGSLSTGFLQSVPAIQVDVRPSQASFWTTSGVVSQALGFTLHYSVATAAPLEEFDRYQVRGQGNDAFRGGAWSVAKEVTGGNGAVGVGSADPFLFEFGTFAPGVTSFAVSDVMSVSGSIFTGSVAQFTNAFSVRVVPEPGTALLLLGGLAAVAARERGRRRR